MCIIYFGLSLVMLAVDTLWTVDFPALSGDWNTGTYWESYEDCYYLDISASAMSGPPYCVVDSLVSPLFTVPESADSLVVVFDHYWWGHGSAFAPQEWASSTSRLTLFSDQGSCEQLWEISAGIFDSEYLANYSGYSSGYIYVPLLFVSPGECLLFQFSGILEADPYNGWVSTYIEWNLYSFSILNYQSVSLERSTWGSIKATF